MGVMDSEYVQEIGPVFFGLYVGACFCTLLATILSGHLMFRHLRNYIIPEQQRCIVRIISMIPIYAAISCAGLWWYQPKSLILAVIRDGYESYALYMFFRLVIEYSLGEEVLIENLNKQDVRRAVFPFNCFKKTLTLCRQGVVQYVILRPLCTIITCLVVFLSDDGYREGEWSLNNAYPYISIVNNISVTVAMYFLVLLYEIVSKDIAVYKPLPKFLCIKAIVFVCYWQGVIIFVMFKIHIIPPHLGPFNQSELTSSLNNLLICLEMVMFSIAHMWAFPYTFYSSLAQELMYADKPLDIAVDVVIGGNLASDAFRAFYPKRFRPAGLTVSGTTPARKTSEHGSSEVVPLIDSNSSSRESYA
ncbi:transmembrane protein [Planoprotostelium fungivorum]|uniref:Transmembrane protein n=1 Tax=Planoprotostelium fungivorum TaxID=1890364 RepID=A0A2P6N6J3_9EUKA|nr:transmembrane protein [Planoprotostelium fungivorum]